MIENKAVYHVLKVIGFHSYWIKYLIQDKKINTYKKVCEITLEQWKIYVQEQTGMDYPLLMEEDDFSRIVITGVSSTTTMMMPFLLLNSPEKITTRAGINNTSLMHLQRIRTYLPNPLETQRPA